MEIPAPLHVLLIEDSPEDRALLRQLLLRGSQQLYKFTEAETGAAGVRALLDHPDDLPDCVLLDFNLPDMDAFEVLAAMRGGGELTVCPVVVVTGAMESGAQVIRAGAQDYVGKGWATPESLTRSIEHAVERYALGRERLLSDAALRESRHFLQRITEVAPGVLHVYDFKKQSFVFVSPMVALVIGYRAEEITAMGRDGLSALIHPEDLPRFAGHLQRLRTLGADEQADFEHRVRAKSGEWRWFQNRVSVFVRDTNGAVQQTIGAALDITERKEAERLRREEQERVATIIDTVDDPIFVKDNEHRVILANRAFCRIFCLDEKNVIGRTLAESVPADERQHFLAVDRRVLDTGLSDLREETLTVEGQTRTIVTKKVRFIESSGQRFLVGSIHDITERKEAEERIRRSEANLNAAQRIAHLGSWEFDLVDVGDLRQSALRWSDEVFRIWGYEPGGIAVTYENFLAAVHPEDRGLIREGIAAALRESRPYDLTHRILRPDGTQRIVRELAEFDFEAGTGRSIRMIGTVLDVTESHGAQQAITQAMERLTEAQRIGQIGDWELDFATQSLGWSPEVFRMFGRDPALGPPKNYEDLKPILEPASWALMNEKLTRASETAEPQDYELVSQRPDGMRVVMQARAAARRGSDGRVVGLYGIVQDITQRKHAEKALEESNRFNIAVMDSIGDHVAVLDGQGNILAVNRAWRKFAEENGAPELGSRAVGMSYLHVRGSRGAEPHGSDADAVGAGLKAVLAGTQRLFQLEYPCPAPHEERWFQVIITPLLGERSGAVVSHENITERKQVEAELKRLAAIVQFSDDAIIATDLNGVITNWNRGAESIFGYKEAEVAGCSLRLLVPPDRQEEEELTLRKIRQGEHLAGFETQRRAKDGRLIDVAITVSPIRNDAGKVIGGSKVARDISGRKAVEAQNLLLEAQLRQSQKLEAIGTLAGGIAHDFNNILSGIYGFTSLAQYAARGNPVLLDYLGGISASGHRAADLVQQILTFARKRGSDEPLEPVQLSQVVAEAVKLLRAASPSTVEIVQELAPGLPPVQGNASQLHQVITNLGTNAVHAMSDHRGRLTIRLDAIEVDTAMALTLFSLQPGPFVRLTVSDSGKGMDAETQLRVFEPFFTTKEPGEGTGLGLSVVHGIVRNHHGAIRLTSEVGRGTTFEIFLQVAAAPLTPVPDIVAAPPTGHSERILLVDDEVAIAKSSRLALGHLGYAAESETQVLKALTRLERDPYAFDIVISDQTMPEMTGLEFAERVRQLRPDLPVLLTTGYNKALTPERIRAAGVREVLPKPFSLEQIALAIRRHLPSAQSK